MFSQECLISPPLLTRTYLHLISGSAPKDHAMIRSLVALLASLPASDSQGFRDEFETVPTRQFKLVLGPTDSL